VRYTYAYKTSDGRRHEAAMDAGSREAVFESLRAQGIRPIKVVAADGSKANGEESLRGSRLSTRVLFVLYVLLVLSLAAGAWLALRGGAAAPSRPPGRPDAAQSFLTARTRRYPIGDAAVIEKGILTGWSEVFPEEGERFFASFAVPGVKAGQRNTTVAEIEAALAREVAAAEADGMEARQIKSMVEGMKAEARAYIKAGGSIVEYGRRLTERQDAEIAIYERAKADFEAARKTKPAGELVAYWEAINDKLRNLGIRLVPLESPAKE
jgi:hypothetical protein